MSSAKQHVALSPRSPHLIPSGSTYAARMHRHSAGSAQGCIAVSQLPNRVPSPCTARLTGIVGRHSDRPAPEETPGAPFAFKDSMIH